MIKRYILKIENQYIDIGRGVRAPTFLIHPKTKQINKLAIVKKQKGYVIMEKAEF